MIFLTEYLLSNSKILHAAKSFTIPGKCQHWAVKSLKYRFKSSQYFVEVKFQTKCYHTYTFGAYSASILEYQLQILAKSRQFPVILHMRILFRLVGF